MLKKKSRIIACLMAAMMVFCAFTGCGNTVDPDSDVENATIDTPETSEEGTKEGSNEDDLTLGLSNGDQYVSRADYTLLGDYYYVESYRIETSDGVMTELGLDMYLTYDEENGYSDPDGVLAIYYGDDGNITSYEAYIGLSPVRATVNYQVGTDCSYFTCICMDEDSVMTQVIWDNYVYNSETGVATYYTGIETYYEGGSTERNYEEQYTVAEDGTLTLSKTITKEYDEEGNQTVNDTAEY